MNIKLVIYIIISFQLHVQDKKNINKSMKIQQMKCVFFPSKRISLLKTNHRNEQLYNTVPISDADDFRDRIAVP